MGSPNISLHKGRPLRLNIFSAFIPTDRIGGLRREDLRKKIKVGPLGGYMFGVEHRDYIRVRSFIDIRRNIERGIENNDSACHFHRVVTWLERSSEALSVLAMVAISVTTSFGIANLTGLWPKPDDPNIFNDMLKIIAGSCLLLGFNMYLITASRDAINLHDFLIQASYPNGPRIDPRDPS